MIHNQKQVKIECLLSVLVSTSMWIYTYLYFYDIGIDNLYLKAFYFVPIVLQIVSIILAIKATLFSRYPLKKSANICVTYSIISFILFLIISRFIMSK